MTTVSKPGQGGFTLLELLVAMGIFAIIGAMALGGLNAVVGQESQARLQTERLAALQRAMRLMTNDLGGAMPRFVRDELGTPCKELPLVADGRIGILIQLTRSGWPNPANLPHRGTLQRVQYRLEDGKLIREYWPVLDRVLGQEPRSEELLSGVSDVKLLFYDGTEGAGEWGQQWPPLRTADLPTGERPRAIQVTLELDDWGTIERVIEVTQ